MVEETTIPYMIFNHLNTSAQVLPGIISKEELPEQFYELTVKFMIENSAQHKWNTIQEFWDFYYSQHNIDFYPFAIYFFMNQEWNVFMYNEDDLLKLYHIRYDEIYHPELFIQGEQFLYYQHEGKDDETKDEVIMKEQDLELHA
jgi:hypothetical protein